MNREIASREVAPGKMVKLVQGDFVIISAGLDDGDYVIVSDVSPAVEGMLLDMVEDKEVSARLAREAAGRGAVQ
jgi:ribosomal protein L24